MIKYSKNKALFLDRDGVINNDYGYVHTQGQFHLREGIIEVCTHAMDKDYLLIIITNQSGIARNYYGWPELHSLHQYMRSLFQQAGIIIDDIYACPHHPDFTGKCLCRKPGTLMLEKAISKYDICVNESFFIGDSLRDIEAGNKVGCKTIYVHSTNDAIITPADEEVVHFKNIIGLL